MRGLEVVCHAKSGLGRSEDTVEMQSTMTTVCYPPAQGRLSSVTANLMRAGASVLRGPALISFAWRAAGIRLRASRPLLCQVRPQYACRDIACMKYNETVSEAVPEPGY